MAYDAEITTPYGQRYSDSGRANSEVSIVPPDQGRTSADEAWVSSNGVVLESPPAPASVTLTAAAATNPVGTSQTVTATVRDDAGDPVARSTVLLTVTGSTSTTGSCATDASGTWSFIDVDDLGEPGAGSDTFKIHTASG